MILLWRTLTQQLAGNNSNNSKQRQWVGKQTTRPTINKLNKRQSNRRIYTKICKQMTNKWSQTTTTRAAAEQEQTETTVRGRRQQSKVRGVSTPVHTHANTHKSTHTQRENSWQFGQNAGITSARNCLYQLGQLNRL